MGVTASGNQEPVTTPEVRAQSIKGVSQEGATPKEKIDREQFQFGGVACQFAD